MIHCNGHLLWLILLARAAQRLHAFVVLFIAALCGLGSNASLAQSATTTTLTASLNPAYVGQYVTLTASVTGNSPTGTVTFMDGATTVATVTLSSTTGMASTTRSFSTEGLHTITAVYNGNTSNAASTSAPVDLNVIPKLETTASLVVSPVAVDASQAVMLTATVAGSGSPTGTVTFMDGITILTSATLDAASAGSALHTFTSVGTRSVTAIYNGDTANASSTSAAVAVSVEPATTSTALTCPTSAPMMAGISCTVTVTAPQYMSVIVGQPVSIAHGGNTIGSSTLEATSTTSGMFTSTVVLSGSVPPLSAVGSYSLQAHYAGTTTTTASTSAEVTVDVHRPSVAASQPPVVAYQYDARGNPTKAIQAPGVTGFGFATTHTYDSLQRLKDSTNAKSGKTQLGYDGRDNLVKVTDPRNLVTQYPRDGLGQATQLVSPDTGTTSHTYDEAGNLRTRSDSRGVLATYGYDALNRLTSLVYTQGGQPSQGYAWQYDLPGVAHSLGRLGQASYPAGTTAYRYDSLGRLVSTAQQLSAAAGANATSLTHSVGYEYDAAGHLTAITYPSGRRLVIGYSGGLPVQLALARDATSAPAALLSQIQWQPFGPVKGWQWQTASGAQPHERSHDTSGRLVRFPMGDVLRDLSYDAADRITSYHHQDAASGAARPELDQFFGYDELGRLTGIFTASASWSIGYDANGNRTSVVRNGSPRAYTTAATSNRLDSLSSPARSFAYDAAGNTTADGVFSATYDLSGRMASLTRAGVTTRYAYDHLGQRVRKASSAADTVVFVYGQDGQLLGEYDAAGNAIREYGWLGATPVAVFTPDAASPTGDPQVFFIHADHLDTPRMVLDRAGNLRWRWLAEPFGSTAAESNPSALGAIVMPLRFPGQYFDMESGLHYNWHRDYDASIGRYVQSDPVGLEGGINTYAYVHSTPNHHIDPDGLRTLIRPGIRGGNAYQRRQWQRHGPKPINYPGGEGFQSAWESGAEMFNPDPDQGDYRPRCLRWECGENSCSIGRQPTDFIPPAYFQDEVPKGCRCVQNYFAPIFNQPGFDFGSDLPDMYHKYRRSDGQIERMLRSFR